MARAMSRELIDGLLAMGVSPGPYSGRGMMGRTCVSAEYESVWDLARCLDENIIVPAPVEDSCGQRTIIYWPYMEWPADVNPANLHAKCGLCGEQLTSQDEIEAKFCRDCKGAPRCSGCNDPTEGADLCNGCRSAEQARA